ncbi:universal stress protein [Ottowia testudinis]|uniref:Universal stress protein n=1 Tax=Ottowia testudinis TaxID=2816950 RepID=A0A975H4P5_9BURK|nr:universal stress protein [Ottowia testudinis]QTD47103.1 universal stress protein [Ottowia testudinis]
MKILLPVDGTELSLHETRFALQLLREGLKASFVLANVQEPATFYEIVTAQSPELIEGAAMEAGEDLMAPAARLLDEAGVPYEAAVVSGDPAQAMLELIEIHRCDMVVMGSRALGPIRRLLEGGSVSQRVVQGSSVPVLLVTPPAAD